MDDFALAAALVHDAATLAARMRRDGVQATHKTSVTDIVTAADHAAEDLVVGRLVAERPDDGIVGEEGAARPGARTWFVDPIDGTYNYACGLPTWCSALALVDESGPVLGAIYCATSDELWLGGPGYPTTRNDVAVAPLGPLSLGQASIATYLHPDTLPDEAVRTPWLRALGPAATMRAFGSGSVELSWVADGRLGGWLQHDSLPWDWLPGSTLVRAAGGAAEVVERHGHRWHLAGPVGVVYDLTDALRGGA